MLIIFNQQELIMKITSSIVFIVLISTPIYSQPITFIDIKEKIPGNYLKAWEKIEQYDSFTYQMMEKERGILKNEEIVLFCTIYKTNSELHQYKLESGEKIYLAGTIKYAGQDTHSNGVVGLIIEEFPEEIPDDVHIKVIILGRYQGFKKIFDLNNSSQSKPIIKVDLLGFETPSYILYEF
jgi:hypothetical protein